MIVSTALTDYGHSWVLGITDETDPRRPYAATRIDCADSMQEVASKLRALAEAIEREHPPARSA